MRKKLSVFAEWLEDGGAFYFATMMLLMVFVGTVVALLPVAYLIHWITG